MTAYISAAIPMTSSSPPGPRRKPKQERARQLVAAIEQACARILEEEGPERLTTNRIAEVAGVNIGSLYQYFANKEAVVAAVFAATIARESEALIPRTRGIDAIAHRSLEDALREVIHHSIELRRSLWRLNEHFYGRYQHTLDVLPAVEERAVARGQPSYESWLTSVLEHHQQHLQVTNLPLAGFLVTRTIEGAIRFAVEDRPELLETPAFEEELLALVMRYLGGGPS